MILPDSRDVKKEVNQMAESRDFVYIVMGAAIVYFIMIASPLVFAAKGGAKPSPPINITSDKMEILDKEGTVHFIGNVKAVRGDLVINADDVTVYYSSQKVAGKTKKVMKKIVAKGHVKVTKEDKVAIGDKAVYDRPREIITLSGNAQVWQGKNRVSGAEILFFVNEDRSIVKRGAKQRVEATVYPNQ